MPSMGFCLSKCLLADDITRDFEDELDDVNHRSGYTQQNDPSGGSAFATTSLLAVRSLFVFLLLASRESAFWLTILKMCTCLCVSWCVLY